MTEVIGYIGLVAITLCWVPQSIETVRAGRCDVNILFLVLSALGSAALTLYAVLRNDPVFWILNSLTALGALLNLFYKFFPRRKHEAPAAGDA